ncbi:MAG: hypothetical protein H0X30_07350 [Anaerolineae bacterium]|nr:hypothetical protein [Anaerolineae bacterium]
MSAANRRSSDGNNLLMSLASTVIVGYLSTRFKLFRTLWRFLPLLVVVSAWFLNRQAEDASTAPVPEAEAEAIA